jgi:hypothetical protein
MIQGASQDLFADHDQEGYYCELFGAPQRRAEFALAIQERIRVIALAESLIEHSAIMTLASIPAAQALA